MKFFISFLIIVICSIDGATQLKLDDFGRIILNTYLPSNIALPAESINQLKTVLNQIAVNNGAGGSQANSRFIITAHVNVGTKDIIAGPPQMISHNLDLVLFVGDASTNTIFSITTLSLKGVGKNENIAFIDAYKTINTRLKEISDFVEEGKNKIINYYNTNCDFIIKDAQALVKQEKYDGAIYQLSLVPDVCKECYFKCLDTLMSIYQKKIDAECTAKFNKAKLIWASAQNADGAERTGNILSSINPMASCQTDVGIFIKSIDAKLKADEKAKWQFIIKQYIDKIEAEKEQVRIAEEKSKRDDIYREKQSVRNYELDKIHIRAFRDVAVEYAKNQPKTVTYNNIYWR